MTPEMYAAISYTAPFLLVAVLGLAWSMFAVSGRHSLAEELRPEPDLPDEIEPGDNWPNGFDLGGSE